MKNNSWLQERQSNVFSQCGEDGVLEAILKLLDNRNRWCVEFGAWDGMHLSNSRNLIENHSYSAVLIEGDKERFKELDSHYRAKENIFRINAFVWLTPDSCLDKLLAATPTPTDFDVLSVDIDGNDFHVWESLQNYLPKIVCIEFNPTIPTEVYFVQKPDIGINQGSSLRALVELAKTKGYSLVSVLAFNAIFVRSDLYHLLNIADNSLESLRTDTSFVTYIFSGYDGTIFLRGCQKLPWHGIHIPTWRIQMIPRILRRYPGESRVKRLAVMLLCNPIGFFGNLRRWAAKERS